MPTILITGANKGIGLELAKQYSQTNWQVIACCRSPSDASELQALKQASKDHFSIYSLELASIDNIVTFSNQVQGQPIDILINNAAVFGPTSTTWKTVDPTAWLDVFKINTIAPFVLAEKLAKNITNSELKMIVNMSSNMGSIEENTAGGEYIYRSSKAALNMITKSLSIDLKELGINVISLHPGWVKTSMGGSNALITTQECVTGIRKVLSALTAEDSGAFIGYDGKRLEW